ncbi:3-deoxy-D-manno-octulosonate 8-phosphate phosphatase KdsC [Arsenophonus endosymbiont of Bemisia tabaci Q2]|nr:3-deoxy-D-manno-octulosonate 8-phosphate phosphatase KdsC [Arsenophonus endosymbiont of Bemisia tabaci Q2]
MNNDNKITTGYGPIDQHIVEKARLIKLLICDVDGVMTDGLIYMGNNGEEVKAFNVKDGYGIRCLLTSAIEVAIITDRKAKLLEDRAKTLGINYLYQGQSEKISL